MNPVIWHTASGKTSVQFTIFNRNTTASAAASKIFIRESSLFPNLRFGGNVWLNSSVNLFATISASAYFVPRPSAKKVFITWSRENCVTLTLCLAANLPRRKLSGRTGNAAGIRPVLQTGRGTPEPASGRTAQARSRGRPIESGRRFRGGSAVRSQDAV